MNCICYFSHSHIERLHEHVKKVDIHLGRIEFNYLELGNKKRLSSPDVLEPQPQWIWPVVKEFRDNLGLQN